MKKLIISILLGALVFFAASANAAPIINTCTSTYEIAGLGIQISGWDTVAVSLDTEPVISITKYAKNIRTGIEDDNRVNALSGDTIVFRIVWANVGGALADTVTLTDYLPSGLTYVTGSFTHSETNCNYAESDDTGGNIYYKVYTAAGTNPGPNAAGEFRFWARVD